MPFHAGRATRSTPTREVTRGPPHRLFFALWPDPSTREALAAATEAVVQARHQDGRRIHPARYHLTLQFLGDIFPPQRERTVARATAAAGQVTSPAFELVLDQAGGFPNERVWWLGPSEVPEGLRHLRDAIGHGLLDVGQKSKTAPAFSPHVTIARDAGATLPRTPIPPLRWQVDRFVLVDSQPPKPYRLLGEWRLRS